MHKSQKKVVEALRDKLDPDIRRISLDRIKPFKENEKIRGIEEEALKGLQKSIESFGYGSLIVINKRNMEIISGHQRFKVLKQLGVKSVKCILFDYDQATHLAMAISMNNQQIAGYFKEAVAYAIDQLRKDLPEEDFLQLRMDALRKEIDAAEIEKTGKTLPDDVPKPPKQAKTKPGDLWILGDHRLLCGDSTKKENVARLMDKSKASLLATDPPYGVDYTGDDRPKAGKNWSNVYKDKIPDLKGLIKNFYKAAFDYLNPKTAFYLWHASKYKRVIEEVCTELNIFLHQQIIWVKPYAVISYSFYSWRHEPCLMMWREGQKPPYNPKEKSISSVWTTDFLKSGDPSSPEYYTDVWPLDWDGKKRNPGIQHPTVKPTEVFAIPMRVHTQPGDICYEPFCGSGSQIIAAERLNRRCFAIELEPVFCDVAVKRWEDFTGEKARLAK